MTATYPLARPSAFAANATNPLSTLDSDLVNLTDTLNSLGNGASTLSTVAIATATITNANLTTALVTTANVVTMSSSNVVITGGTAVLSTANVATLGAAKINFGDGTTQNTASFLNTWTSYTPLISSFGGNLVTTSATGNFLTTGKTTFFSVTLTLTNVGNVTGIQYTLPIAVTNPSSQFVFLGRENGVTGKVWQSIFGQGAISSSAVQDYTGTATVANGYVLIFSGVYNNQ